MKTRLILLALALPLVAACGGTLPAGSADAEPPATTAEPRAFAYPTDGDAVVLDVTTGGGFVPVEVAVDTRPDFRLYGDGTVLAKPEEPELRFPSLRTYRLTPEGVQAVLAAAEAAGLLGPPGDYGQPLVTDLPTTTLTVNLERASYSQSAYALGFEDAAGLTPSQQEARSRLAGFTAFLAGLDAARPELLASPVAPYEPEAVRVYAWESETEPDRQAPRWPLAEGIESWPAEQSFGARCRLLLGAELGTLRAALPEPPPWLWQSGGTWSVGVALHLPGDAGCDGTLPPSESAAAPIAETSLQGSARPGVPVQVVRACYTLAELEEIRGPLADEPPQGIPLASGTDVT